MSATGVAQLWNPLGDLLEPRRFAGRGPGALGGALPRPSAPHLARGSGAVPGLVGFIKEFPENNDLRAHPLPDLAIVLLPLFEGSPNIRAVAGIGKQDVVDSPVRCASQIDRGMPDTEPRL